MQQFSNCVPQNANRCTEQIKLSPHGDMGYQSTGDKTCDPDLVNLLPVCV